MDEGKGWMGERDGSNGARIEGRIVEEARFAFHQSTSLSGRLAWFHNESYTLIWRQPQIFTTVIIKSVHFNDCFPPVNHLCSVLPLWDPSLLHHSSPPPLCLFLSSRFSLPNRSAVVSSCGLTGEGFPPLLLPSLLSRSPLSFDLFPSSLLLPSETYKGKRGEKGIEWSRKARDLVSYWGRVTGLSLWRPSPTQPPLDHRQLSFRGKVNPTYFALGFQGSTLQFSLTKSEVEDQIRPCADFLPASWGMCWCISNNEGGRDEKGWEKRGGSIDPVRVCSLLLEWLFDAWESRCFNDLG